MKTVNYHSKYRLISVLLCLLVCGIIYGQKTIADKFIVDTFELKSAVFNNTRTIRVLLPPDYFEYNETDKKYPVLYLNDGIALFHAYNLKETVHELIKSRQIEPLIIVGIDNGGSTKESRNPMLDRANEYLPWPDLKEENPALQLTSPKGNRYPSFLIKEVMPLIKKNFRIKEGPKHTGLGGSSYGGLIALYTVMHHPAFFKTLLIESPSLYVYNQQILKEAEKIKEWPRRIYLGIGTAEGETETIQQMAVADTKTLKEIITKTQIRMRKAYGHNNETMPRRASFAGSVNTAQFLNDSTGSRRFLCFELEGIKYQHEVDINLAFSQALFLFKSGFRHWFDQEEIKSITENNEQYQLRSPEEELLLTWFEPCEREKANAFLNTSQIASKLAEKAKINITDSTINKLGRALKKHNFLKLKKNGIFVYALTENSWEDVDNSSKIADD